MKRVPPLDMVENSTSPLQTPFRLVFVIGQSGQATFSRSEAPIESFCWHLHRLRRGMTLLSHRA